jgi:hypothetical protein
MSTIIDLNTATTVTFNNESDYAIVFGANAGNTTANVDAYGSANISKQTPLNSITDAVRDLLIDVQFSNVGNVSMAYVGTWANVGLLQIAPAAWRVDGIRTVAQYNEAFANVKYTDLTGAQATSPEYSYITTVNDQSGNTRTWNTTVDVLVQPTITVSGDLVYNEDTLTPMTQVSIAVDPDSTNVFRMFANTVPTYGSMTDGVITGNSVFIDGNVTSLNSQISAGAVKFLPASDLVSNVANAISINLTTPSVSVGNANVNIQIGNTHAEYNFPDGTFTEDVRLAFGNTISDLDTRALSFTIGIQQTAGNIGQFYVSNSLVGNASTRLNLTGSKAGLNNTIQWMPPIDYTGNVSFTYNQIKTLSTGNVTQASNVVATFTAITNPEISNMIDRSYTSNTVNNIFSVTTPYLNDGPDYGQIYTITLSSPVGYFGNTAQSAYNNFVASTNYTYTGNTTQVNNEFSAIKFLANVNISSNSTFTYTQSRDSVPQVNTTLNLTGSQGFVTPAVYSFTSNSAWTPTVAEAYYGGATVLTVGGGGGGSQGYYLGAPGSSRPGGGGGGGGKLTTYTFGVGSFTPGSSYSVVIGQGGNGAVASSNVSVTGSSGGSTVFYGSYSSPGGVGGQANVYSTISSGGASGNAKPGGSGATRTAYPAPSSQFSGPHAGGGGGDSANGGSAVKTVFSPTTIFGRGGAGGDGSASTITGSTVYYGGGGAGGYGPGGATSASGGQGGGGSTASVDGTNGTGGGGAGGGSLDMFPPGRGGSGIVIISVS